MNATQDEPMQDGNAATDGEKIAGIVGQVRGDIALGHEGDARVLLEQRFHDAALDVSPADFEAALAEATDAS